MSDTGHPLLVHFLARLIDRYDVPARDSAAFARAIQLYSARRVKFFRERPERFQSAVRTLAWGIGDCDDKARLVAAALRTMRIPVQLAFMHITMPNGQTLGHVWPRAWLSLRPKEPAQWVDLESVREYPVGYSPAKRAKEKGLTIKSLQYIGDAPGDQIHI